MKAVLKKPAGQKKAGTENNLEAKTSRLLFLFPLFLGIAGFLFLIFSTSKYGVGVSGDSAEYIMWARNFCEHHTFTKPDGRSLIIFPPLYPVTIAIFNYIGIDAFLAVRLINAIFFSMIIFLTGIWILRYLGSLFLSIAGSLLVLFSYPIFSVCCWAWTEPLFIFLVTIFLFLTAETINNPSYKKTILLAAVTSAACLTRYAGLVLYPVGAILLFFGIKDFRKKIIHCVVWGIVSTVLFGLWLARNMTLSGTTMGVRFPSTSTLWQNIKTAGGFLERCFIIQRGKELIPGWIFLALIIISATGVLIYYFYKMLKRKEINWPIASVALYVTFFLAQIIYAATNTSMGFEDRHYVPVFPAVIMFMASGGAFLLKIKNIKIKLISATAIVIFTGIWLLTGLDYALNTTRMLSRNGFGLVHSSWKNSEVVNWLKLNKLDGEIYTNDTGVIYIQANIDAKMVPAKPNFIEKTSEKAKFEIEKQLVDFEESLNSGQKVYLVWFARHFRKYLYDPKELSEYCNLKLIHKLRDGYIVALYPKEKANQ